MCASLKDFKGKREKVPNFSVTQLMYWLIVLGIFVFHSLGIDLGDTLSVYSITSVLVYSFKLFMLSAMFVIGARIYQEAKKVHPVAGSVALPFFIGGVFAIFMLVYTYVNDIISYKSKAYTIVEGKVENFKYVSKGYAFTVSGDEFVFKDNALDEFVKIHAEPLILRSCCIKILVSENSRILEISKLDKDS